MSPWPGALSVVLAALSASCLVAVLLMELKR